MGLKVKGMIWPWDIILEEMQDEEEGDDDD